MDAETERSAEVFVGSQEIMGDMCEWHVDVWAQRVGIDWLVIFNGQEGREQKIGPLEARVLAEEMEDRRLDVGEFTRQLLANRLPMLTKLSQEIEEAQGSAKAPQ